MMMIIADMERIRADIRRGSIKLCSHGKVRRPLAHQVSAVRAAAAVLVSYALGEAHLNS
jgi:hypothetical protein